jgi:phage baseplate assembly protein W
MPVNIDFPFHFDHRKCTAVTDDDEHVRDLIEALVLTGPGERVNRPAFGSGLQQLAFAPNSPELAAAVQFLVQGGLQRYLGDRLDVESVQVDAEDSTLRVEVTYVIRRNGRRETTRLTTGA